MKKDLHSLVSFLKENGFIYPSSEIYGGLANSWDYGPIGTLLKDNLKQAWKEFFIFKKENSFLFDSSIILNNKVWEASGHLSKFNDYVIECLNDNTRYRIDKLVEEHLNKSINNLSLEEVQKLIKEKIQLSKYKENTKWGEVKKFSLMFAINSSKTGNDEQLYLRPETAQGIFINFKNITDTLHPKLPFSIGQIGKAFRNEVTPGNFIFRTKEFEQLELERFIFRGNNNNEFELALQDVKKFLITEIGIGEKKVKFVDVKKEDLAHYSKRTIDVNYEFPFGEDEILGIADRGDFDISNHKEKSNTNIFYLDPKTNKKVIPHIIETSMGVERLLFALILENYDFEKRKMFFPFKLAPYKIAICPLTKNEINNARDLYQNILKEDMGPVIFLESGSIGKRYFKQDAIGTPFVITVDGKSKEDEMFTIRHWDNKQQDRIKLEELNSYLKKYAK